MAELLTSEKIKAIEAVLKKGDRVMLIPNKDGVRIEGMRRYEIKPRLSKKSV